MATQSSVLAWRIPMDRGAWGVTWGCKESDMTEITWPTQPVRLGQRRGFQSIMGDWSPFLVLKMLSSKREWVRRIQNCSLWSSE